MTPWQQKIAEVRRLLDWLEDDLQNGPHKDVSNETKLSVVLGMLLKEGARDEVDPIPAQQDLSAEDSQAMRRVVLDKATTKQPRF